MKSKMFLACLNKAVRSGRFSLDGKEGALVLSSDGNSLECELDGKGFDFCVDKIEASKKDGGQFYKLLSQAKKESTKKENKKTKPKKEDKE